MAHTIVTIVNLSSGPKTQLSMNISRRKAKTSSACIEIKIEKNDTFSQLIDLSNRAFPYPGLAQGDSPSAGPELAHTHAVAHSAVAT